MTRNLKVFVVLFLLTVVTMACNKDLITNTEVQEKVLRESDDVTFVSKSKANEIAEAFFGTLSNDLVTKSNINLASTETIRDSSSENTPLMYVINYADGGFVIISATKDYYPVLAYSDEGSFVLREDMGSVAVWLGETKEAIRQSKTLNKEIKAKISSMWRRYDPIGSIISHKTVTKSLSEKDEAMANRIGELTNMGYTCYSLESAYTEGLISHNLYQACLTNAYELGTLEYPIVVLGNNYTYSQVGPLVLTRWGQKNDYNLLCNNFPGPAGYGTIAMAQIMKFHQFPSTFDWANMDNYPANHATQLLIGDINARIGSESNPNETKSAFEYFGYNATIYNHDKQSVESELFHNRPMLMSGFTRSFLGNGTGTGHAWICDGVSKESSENFHYVEFLIGDSGDYYYEYDKNICTPHDPIYTGGYISTYFHMNWGWYSYSDGWFAGNDVDTSEGNFNHARKNIYVSK